MLGESEVVFFFFPNLQIAFKLSYSTIQKKIQSLKLRGPGVIINHCLPFFCHQYLLLVYIRTYNHCISNPLHSLLSKIPSRSLRKYDAQKNQFYSIHVSHLRRNRKHD
jgi:hypothetical protein